MFSWDNLFWVCGHCNNIKSDIFDDILNCTDKNDAIENKLNYYFKTIPYEPVKITVNANDSKTLQTQKLLLAVFNGTTKLKEIESSNIRKHLLKEIREFEDFLIEYCENICDEEDKSYYLRKVKQHLNSTSAFTSFKRQIIKDNDTLFKKFGCYFK